ncbi:MAG: Na+/H+ antiporter NhaA [Akkermansiaceae bacterium]|nr:Na+/H+ antiporter NhaA [Akkermansiaceae bacterium]
MTDPNVNRPSPSEGGGLGSLFSHALREFLRLESAGGILLVMSAVVAMLWANSPARGVYETLLALPVQLRVGALDLDKPLLLWINDGLMAVFFFLIGLELKRELVEGELSHRSKLVLPGLGALGGMAVPALIYVACNWGNSLALQGWAIPAATDIAFALGILTLLGSRVPLSLKVFLVSLAIVDDIGAILIIALFYTAQLSLTALMVAGLALVGLWLVNRRGVQHFTPYLLLGLILWVAVLKSGVHATLAGVTLAAFIPIRSATPEGPSLLKTLEHDLHGTVAFVILPVFALANAGVSLAGFTMAALFSSVPLGIMLGLFVGKMVGVFSLVWFGVRMRWTRLPEGMTWASLAGVSVLCGVGFTMSLFIGSLAFEGGGLPYDGSERLGVLLGSGLSAVTGFLILRKVLPAKGAMED